MTLRGTHACRETTDMPSAKEALARDAAPESWLPLLALACREVFEIMLASKLTPGDSVAPVPTEITAMVGLAGRLCGVLSVRCNARAAALMASKMLGTDVGQAEEHMWDAYGEIANMIAGNFKNKLTGIGEKCMLSVPTVITGADYAFHAPLDAAPLSINFQFEGEPVSVIIEVQSEG